MVGFNAPWRHGTLSNSAPRHKLVQRIASRHGVCHRPAHLLAQPAHVAVLMDCSDRLPPSQCPVYASAGSHLTGAGLAFDGAAPCGCEGLDSTGVHATLRFAWASVDWPRVLV